jgi:hypothetical protein
MAPAHGAPRKEAKGKKARPPKGEQTGVTPSPASLLPLTASPAPLEALLQGCLEKGIDLELILQQWQVSRLEELEEHQVQQVREWLKTQ